MNADQIERLLVELSKTRKSFEKATEQIRWNRINTIIQYVLTAVIIVMIGFGVRYYLDEKKAACERSNDLRAQISVSLDSNAASIGAALVIVTGASPEAFQEYMDAYAQQDKPPILEMRDC